jgi:hypothetical protein
VQCRIVAHLVTLGALAAALVVGVVGAIAVHSTMDVFQGRTDVHTPPYPDNDIQSIPLTRGNTP